MKAIKINCKNIRAIEAALAEVNGKASAHTYNAAEIIAISASAEKQLEKVSIAKSKRKGAKFHAISGGVVPNAYKYQRQVTCVMLERNSVGWLLVEAKALSLYPNQRGGTKLYLTADQDEIAMRAARTWAVIEKADA